MWSIERRHDHRLIRPQGKTIFFLCTKYIACPLQRPLGKNNHHWLTDVIHRKTTRSSRLILFHGKKFCFSAQNLSCPLQRPSTRRLQLLWRNPNKTPTTNLETTKVRTRRKNSLHMYSTTSTTPTPLIFTLDKKQLQIALLRQRYKL